MLGLGLSIPCVATRSIISLEYQVAALFSAGEQGAWYDPSDFSTMFQDAAGSIPVTAVGQAVGRILDKSGRGNHATQSTSTKRPVLQQDANGKYYLLFDGIDDALQTASINFTGTDKVTVWAGVRKLSDAARGIIVEAQTAGAAGGTTVFALSAPQANGANNYAAFVSYIITKNATAPSTNILTGEYFPSSTSSTEQVKFRVDGIQQTTITGSAIATSTVNQPVFIGSRGATTLPFNGRLYSLIIRGAQSTDTQITNTENYVNSKTGAY